MGEPCCLNVPKESQAGVFYPETPLSAGLLWGGACPPVIPLWRDAVCMSGVCVEVRETETDRMMAPMRGQITARYLLKAAVRVPVGISLDSSPRPSETNLSILVL